jgi:hypothetical protein
LDRDHFKLPAQLLVTVQFDKEASQAVLNHKNRDAPRGSPGSPSTSLGAGPGLRKKACLIA